MWVPKFGEEDFPSVWVLSSNFEPVRTAERLSTGKRTTGNRQPATGAADESADVLATNGFQNLKCRWSATPPESV